MTTKITIYLIAIMLAGCGMFKKKNANTEVLADPVSVFDEKSTVVDTSIGSDESPLFSG